MEIAVGRKAHTHAVRRQNRDDGLDDFPQNAKTVSEAASNPAAFARSAARRLATANLPVKRGRQVR